MGTESFNTYATEMNQLVEQGLQLGNSKLGNDYLFSGTALSTASFTTTTTAGQIDSVTYAGNATALSISLSDNAAINPGSSIQTNHDIATFLNHLIDMRNAFTAKDSSALMTARDTIIGTDIAPGDEDNILSSMSELGAVQTRIEISNTQRTERLDNIESLVSNEVNVDMPETITKLNQTSTAYQAALQSAAMIMKTSLLDYIS
jgi:flagellar hook-associated protein 3 FlgL